VFTRIKDILLAKIVSRKWWYLIQLQRLYFKNLFKIIFRFDSIAPNLLLPEHTSSASRRIRDEESWAKLKKAHLACGSNYLKGYINVDMPIDAKSLADTLGITVDARAFLNDLSIFETESLDVVECYNAIEHLTFWDAEQALNEFSRVLKPGGELVIECPDMYKCTMNYLAKPDGTKIGLAGLYGDLRYKINAMVHRFAYSQEYLARLLNTSGFPKELIFSIPARRWQQRDFRMVAFKSGIDREMARRHALERVMFDNVKAYKEDIKYQRI